MCVICIARPQLCGHEGCVHHTTVPVYCAVTTGMARGGGELGGTAERDDERVWICSFEHCSAFERALLVTRTDNISLFSLFLSLSLSLTLVLSFSRLYAFYVFHDLCVCMQAIVVHPKCSPPVSGDLSAIPASSVGDDTPSLGARRTVTLAKNEFQPEPLSVRWRRDTMSHALSLSHNWLVDWCPFHRTRRSDENMMYLLWYVSLLTRLYVCNFVSYA